MDLRKLSLTLPLASSPPSPEALITVFHRWIQQDKLTKLLAESSNDALLLIDVVDYRHVHEGPGIMLVAHEAYFSLGSHGLRIATRRDDSASFEAALRTATRRLLTAAALLESELSLAPLAFATDALAIEALDRLRAPTAGDLATAASPILETILGPITIDRPSSDPRGPAQIAATAASSRRPRELIDRI